LEKYRKKIVDLYDKCKEREKRISACSNELDFKAAQCKDLEKELGVLWEKLEKKEMENTVIIKHIELLQKKL